MFTQPDGEKQKEVYFILGSHLDLFWMGTYEQCLEKGIEIIKKALELYKKYNEYCFFIETVVFIDYFLKKYPDYKEFLIKLIKEGRIEVGGVYVDRIEHSHGGESLIRQTIYGVKWIKDNLEIIPESVMHPDLPGLSPQVPQIYAKAGVKYYLQARGPFLYRAIRKWQAPDGSNIIYCGLPLHYGAKDDVNIEWIFSHSDGFSLNKIVIRGGYADLVMPDIKIIEQIKRLCEKYKDVAFYISSPSKVLSSYTSVDLPIIKGEVPFGWGSAAAGKVNLFQMSAKLENMLLTCEKFFTIAEMIGLKVFPLKKKESKEIDSRIYQHMLNKDIYGNEVEKGKELEEVWRYELFTQDHNYAGRSGSQSEFDKREMKKYALNYVDDVLDSSLTEISRQIKLKKKSTSVVVYNPISCERSDVVKLDTSLLNNQKEIGIKDNEGKVVPHQMDEDGLYFLAKEIPSLGYRAYYLEKVKENKLNNFIVSRRMKNKEFIENDFFRLKINLTKGIVESIYDKELDKEIIDKNNNEMFFGELISYEDRGVDVRYDFTGKQTRDSNTYFKVKSEEAGGIFTKITLETLFLDAKLEKEIILYNKINRIDFKVRIFWWGKKKEHIRLCFPFTATDFQQTYYGVPFYTMKWPEMMQGANDENILRRGNMYILEEGRKISSDELTYEDRRHFREVAKWLDINYKNYGITVTTKTPTFWINNQTVQAVLLRVQYSCGDPRLWCLNPGKHEWEFSISTHQGDWKEGKAYYQGWNFNNSLLAKIVRNDKDKGNLPQKKSFCSISPNNLLITAMKKSYQDNSIIIRYIEMEGKDIEAKINFFRPIKEAFEVNLLEEEEKKLIPKENTFRVKTKGYEIKTLKTKV